MPFPRLALVIPLSLLGVPSALSFASLPPGTSPHDEITRIAAEATGYPTAGQPALQEAVRVLDLSEMEWDPSIADVAAVGLQDAYRPEHHCDRLVPADDATSFRAAAEHIALQRRLADESMAAGNASAAVGALGEALHALQDCFSHTSAAEDGPAQLEALESALLDGGPMPEGLRLGAMDAGADSPGDSDDPYAHDRHAKDTPHYNEVASTGPGDGGTHFDDARDAATNATVRVLEDFLRPLDDDQRRQLAAVDADDHSGYLQVVNAKTVAVLAVLVAVIGLAGYAGFRWWRAR